MRNGLKYCFILILCKFMLFTLSASQIHYKMYCMYTPDFEDLLKEFFLPSLKDDFELVVKEYPQDCPTGIFRTEGWNVTMLNKLKLLEEAILENWNDQVFFYSDIDIIFFKPILEISLDYLGDNDFVVQQSWPKNKLCAGFFVMRGNPKTLKLVRDAYNLLQENICVDDQIALQTVLDNLKPKEVAWKLLPSELYPNGKRVLKKMDRHYFQYSEIELTNSMILFHANCCIGLENKFHFLRRVRLEFMKNQGITD